MPFPAAPGVYVEEAPGGPRPIAPVGTSTAAFVGAAPDAEARLGEAVPIVNWSQFVKIFAGPEDALSTALSRAVYGFFENEGSRCYIVNVPEGEPIAGGGRGARSGLELLRAVDEVAIVAAPGRYDPLSYEAVLSHCEDRGDRMAILDPPPHMAYIDPLTKVGTARETTRPRPSRAAGSEGGGGATADTEGSGSESSGTSPTSTPPPAEDTGVAPRRSDYGSLYFPWLYAYDPLSRGIQLCPPSGHVAGAWARTDAERGVHKAPANVPLAGGVTDLAYQVTPQEQEVLNPHGVNCIRRFRDDGIKIWGARTLADQASEWRYLNVRRLTCMLKESIEEGMRWVVFEPNDFTLHASIRRDLTNFLKLVWRSGALFGATAEQAFYVKCDEETNPPEVRDAGQVVTEIGIAPVKPAEFVIFRLSQAPGRTGTEIMGG